MSMPRGECRISMLPTLYPSKPASVAKTSLPEKCSMKFSSCDASPRILQTHSHLAYELADSWMFMYSQSTCWKGMSRFQMISRTQRTNILVQNLHKLLGQACNNNPRQLHEAASVKLLSEHPGRKGGAPPTKRWDEA